ncbi:ankyrin repeat-containing domain protein [Cercophora scortea]|uniref:Ankyrin repeat-containing domain protein n=1 Tax=Cercophora scortea TaxID=314031 RepID=A0AAE0M390_9PEZI|nr:ankyrin repeat-containing domain protein [Cercophora scortea]
MLALLGKRDAITFLLDQGIPINTDSDPEGRTMLACAALKGDTTLCNMLLDCGANIEAQDKFGCTPLNIAAAEGELEAVWGTMAGRGHTVVSIAAKNGRVGVVRFLLEETEALAYPPHIVRGQKWKNFAFSAVVDREERNEILELLRRFKHMKG